MKTKVKLCLKTRVGKCGREAPSIKFGRVVRSNAGVSYSVACSQTILFSKERALELHFSKDMKLLRLFEQGNLFLSKRLHF